MRVFGKDILLTGGACQWRRRAGKRRAFTLVELLVVIGIIAVLAGLILAAVSEVRQSGLGAACRSNLKQIGAGATIYINDNGRLPELTNMPSLNLNGLPTMTEVIDAGSDEVFRCPGDDQGFYEVEETSYEWNTLLNGARPSSFEKPTVMPIMWDYEPFHAEETRKGARNALYLDMHVEGL